MNIAIVDDDPDVLGLITVLLTRAGHTCAAFTRGADLLAEARRRAFDMIVVDWMLPDTSGVDLVATLRELVSPACCLFMVTSRNKESDVVLGLQKGANDYMVKPLRSAEFLARVNAIAQRRPLHPPPALGSLNQWGAYVFDVAKRELQHNGKLIRLSPHEYDLALYMFTHLGVHLKREVLLMSVFGRSTEEVTRTLDTHVSRIKRKINLTRDGEFQIVCHYGYGYSLQPTQRTTPPDISGHRPAAASPHSGALQ